MVQKVCEAFSHNHFSFSINVMMEDIEDEALGEYLWEMVQTYGMQVRMILEIVETENITNFCKAEAFVKRIKKIISSVYFFKRLDLLFGFCHLQDNMYFDLQTIFVYNTQNNKGQ